MTLEELRKQYERFSEMAGKRGDMYSEDAEDAKEKGNYESANLYYSMASSAYYEGTIYMQVVNDLLKVTK